MLWYALEAPCQGASNEYPQHMFSRRNKKDIMWIPPLICSYDNFDILFETNNDMLISYDDISDK